MIDMPLTKVVLLVVGSFNPPTIMHLRMLEIAKDHLNRTGQFKVIGGVVSPVHDKYGKENLAYSTDRCEMLRLALNNSNWIQISEWESKQDHWTRTRMVLQHHQNQLNAALSCNETPNKQQNQQDQQWISRVLEHCNRDERVLVKLVCGADVLQTFGVPGLWMEEDIETIVGEHGLVVVTRENVNAAKIIYESDLLTKYQRNITIVSEWITNEISSTKIRRALRRGESVKYIVADAVIDYIHKNGLYMTIDNKYELFPADHQSSIFLTPSPNDVPMPQVLLIDVPDNSGNYVTDHNQENMKRSRPGGPVKVVDEGGRGVKVRFQDEIASVDDLDDLPKVEIQITEDGTIQVISDKETTV